MFGGGGRKKEGEREGRVGCVLLVMVTAIT